MVGSGSTGGECKLAQKDRKTKKEWKRCDMGSNLAEKERRYIKLSNKKPVVWKKMGMMCEATSEMNVLETKTNTLHHH